MNQVLVCLFPDSKIPAETVPGSKSYCPWKPGIQTRALISTYVVVAAGTLPIEFSQEPQEKPMHSFFLKKSTNTRQGWRTYLCARLQSLVHLIDSVLWLYHVWCMSPIKYAERRRIEGVMWCAGHLACLSKIKLNRVSGTSMQSTWAVFFTVQSRRTHTRSHTHRGRQAGRQTERQRLLLLLLLTTRSLLKTHFQWQSSGTAL